PHRTQFATVGMACSHEVATVQADLGAGSAASRRAARSPPSVSTPGLGLQFAGLERDVGSRPGRWPVRVKANMVAESGLLPLLIDPGNRARPARVVPRPRLRQHPYSVTDLERCHDLSPPWTNSSSRGLQMTRTSARLPAWLPSSRTQ